MLSQTIFSYPIFSDGRLYDRRSKIGIPCVEVNHRLDWIV